MPRGFWVIWSTVALDLVGFGIVVPILGRYAERFGAGGVAVGLLFASFSLAQFVFAPLLGRLSDRIGREWVWSIACFGFAICYASLIALEHAPSDALLYLMIVSQGLLGYALASVMGAIVAEIFQKMGMQTVNMPGGEIVPAAQRGVIDCAEWVGGVEDLRLGLHNVWKIHYTPGVHENNTIGEVTFNLEVWKSFTPPASTIASPHTSAARISFRVLIGAQATEQKHPAGC